MPDPEGTCEQQAMVDGPQEVASETEQVQHDAVHRQEPSRVRGECEPPQVALESRLGRLVRP